MKKDDHDGRPSVIHSSSKGLGIRPVWDIPVDEDGIVERCGEGLSVAPQTPANLPTVRKPPSLGGEGKYPVWELDTELLPESLVYTEEERREGPPKGLIEPAFAMELEDFQVAIAETRDLWRELDSLQ